MDMKETFVIESDSLGSRASFLIELHAIVSQPKSEKKTFESERLRHGILR